MNIPSHESRFSVEPHDTGARFDLSDEEISKSKDVVEWHPAGNIRFIKYPTPSKDHLVIQRNLARQGLILGRKLNKQELGEQVFVIPISARPIAYDAPQNETGELAYGDKQLFYDLGKLLSQASYIVQHKKLITGDIGHLVAYKEFSMQDERKLYLVPGIENHFSDETSLLNDEQAEYYANLLSDRFGERFDHNRSHFVGGFNEQNFSNLGGTGSV